VSVSAIIFTFVFIEGKKMTASEKLESLRSILRDMREVVVAYSGGVDSAFLLKVAAETLGITHVKAILAISPTYPSREYDRALETASNIGVEVEIIRTKELEDTRFKNNPVDRCYFCKFELFSKIADHVASNFAVNMVDGSNQDDMQDHRPGKKALKEKNIRSPLQEAGLTKAEIRELSHELGLPTWDKDALACLSSRFPYGEHIDMEKLAMVDEAENFLSDLGFRNIRARYIQKSIRIEISAGQIALFANDQLRARVVSKMKELGFQYVTLDLEGYRQGSLNETLKVQNTDLKGLKIVNPFSSAG
jgi:uncharacterized protein